jgi:hypothetical protein
MRGIYDYVIGEFPRLTGEFRVDGVLTDPDAVRFIYTPPGGERTVLVYGEDDEVVREAEGKYYVDLELVTAGTWHYRWESDGAVEAAAQKTIRVQRDITE